MPADSNFPNLPPSPIRDDDKFLVNRSNVSHKIDASDLLYYFANVEFPVQKPCDGNQDCPSGMICVDGYCVERCDCPPDYDCCPEGFVCVDVNNSGNDFVCIPYPFPCGTIDGENPCPDEYICWNGMCIELCGDCPPGTICSQINIGTGAMPDMVDVCLPYPFPCPENNVCPDGFECFMGYCVIDCGKTPIICPDGHECIEIEVIDDVNGNKETKFVCQPVPFPCGITSELDPSTGDILPCPDGYYCYGGMCYQLCDITDPANGGCPPGFECTNIGNFPNNEDGNDTDNDDPPVTICIPSNPSEGLINDGKLNIIDDNNDRRTIFSANQYGDTFLKFNGIDIDGGNGGGSGTGDLTFKTLWERRDPYTRDSDIEPTYENVNALPHGYESNIGYPSVGDSWKGVYAHSLRDVDTAGDHIATGTTGQRPLYEPEGGSIQAGEIRFNTDRQGTGERYTQSQHDKDLEVYNGSEWVRMNPKAVAPQYDDNYEKRLIYGRGLTIQGTNQGGCPDSDMASFTGAYAVPAIEPKLGRGLGWAPDGSIELQNDNDDDDVLIWYKPLFEGNSTGTKVNLGPNSNTWQNGTGGGDTVTFTVPAGANRAIVTFAYKLKLYPRPKFDTIQYNLQDLNLDFGTGGGNINNAGNVKVEDQISTCICVADPVAYWGGNVGAENINGRSDRIGTNTYVSMPFHKGMPVDDVNIFAASWTQKVEDVKFNTSAGGTLEMAIELERLNGINCEAEVNVYRIMVQPYNSTRPAIRSTPVEYEI